MDKNTIIGFVLIGLLIFGFTWFNRPSKEQLAQQQRSNDSIAAVQEAQARIAADSLATDSVPKTKADSAVSDTSLYGAFAPAAKGNDKNFVLENNLVRLVISAKGGQVVSAQLKKYTTNDHKPLVLFDSKKDSTMFNLTLPADNGRIVSTKDLYFESLMGDSVMTVNQGQKSFTLRLKTSGNAYIDYVYTLKSDDYMIGFSVMPHNMQNVMPRNANSVELLWQSKIRCQERSKKFESRYAQLCYKPTSDDMEKLSESKSDNAKMTTKVRWVAFKDQFFSTVLIADNSFNSGKFASTKYDEKAEGNNYLKAYRADLDVPFDPTGKTATNFRLYFGPNHFKTLHAYDKGVENSQKLQLNKLVPLGWGIFGWINQYCIIPMFNFFSGFISNFGIIILLMTIIIKLVISPLTYKSYLSTAKMRVLKPQIDEINQRIPASKAQERQMATMALYKKAGVNPMGGCLPMLLQMPVLFAMFCFFPAAIELRQQSFLWAPDLSSYDSIVSWNAQIPFISNYFGNHLSLFCLLMTITNIVYTHINMKSTEGTSQQMPGMKWMMYLMPLMFLFVFNDYASGLSYYYFISTLITIAQTLAIRSFVDEEKLLKKLHEKANKNEKKPKKSGFLERLQEAQRKQMEMQRKRAHKK